MHCVPSYACFGPLPVGSPGLDHTHPVLRAVRALWYDGRGGFVVPRRLSLPLALFAYIRTQ